MNTAHQRSHKFIRFLGNAVVLSMGAALLLLASCGPRQAASSGRKPTKTPIPPSVLTATSEAWKTHAGAIRFMTYNVQLGGDIGGDGGSLDQGRIPLILEVIREYDPDVIGIQEALGWDRGAPPLIQQIADALGMNYVYCKNPFVWDEATGASLDGAILSKFEIEDSETYADENRSCLARAALRLPAGQLLQAFSTHVIFVLEMGCVDYEIAWMADRIRAYSEELMVAMGDWNINYQVGEEAVPAQVCFDYLEGAGLTLVGGEPVANGILGGGEVDLVFFSDALLAYPYHFLVAADRDFFAAGRNPPASDHYPRVVDLTSP